MHNAIQICVNRHLFGEGEVGLAHLRGRGGDHEVALDRGAAIAVGWGKQELKNFLGQKWIKS